jgi:hypothetical protein
MSPKHGKRDKNEREIVEVWRALGAVWIPQPQESGFDGILVCHGIIYIVEIKDVSNTNGRYKLTPNEETTKSILEYNGAIKYNIIKTVQEALDLVGAL